MTFDRDIIFIGDGQSKDFYDVLPQTLTLRKPVPGHIFKSDMKYHHDTIFKEVSFNRYKQSDETAAFLNTPHKRINSVWELYEVLKRVIERQWDTSKVHVIGHSSGYDSRIISNAIKELGEKNGKEWLGEVICIEVLGEGKQFKRIMEIQGLKGIVYKDGCEKSEQHRESFEFNTFYKKFNGVTSFPVNQWYDAYAHLEKDGVLDSSKTQCFTGYGANETMEIAHKGYKGRDFAWYFRWHHYLQIQNFKLWGDNWVHPFWDYEFLNALAGFNTAKKWKSRIASVMAAKVTPHLLHIPNMFTELGNMKPVRTLNDDLLIYAIDSYNNSWYGKHIRVPMKNDFMNYRSWWGHYCAASVCEYLLKKGHKINGV